MVLKYFASSTLKSVFGFGGDWLRKEMKNGKCVFTSLGFSMQFLHQRWTGWPGCGWAVCDHTAWLVWSWGQWSGHMNDAHMLPFRGSWRTFEELHFSVSNIGDFAVIWAIPPSTLRSTAYKTGSLPYSLWLLGIMSGISCSSLEFQQADSNHIPQCISDF